MEFTSLLFLETKRKRKGNLASRPLDFYFFSLEVLGGVGKQRRGGWPDSGA